MADKLPLAFGDGCMHEFVLSGAPMKKELGIKTLDLAKRLLDHGYHPPTVYFPLLVDEALLVEPTETETRETLDGFAEAIAKILTEAGDDPLIAQNAPYTTPVRRLDEAARGQAPIIRQPPRSAPRARASGGLETCACALLAAMFGLGAERREAGLQPVVGGGEREHGEDDLRLARAQQPHADEAQGAPRADAAGAAQQLADGVAHAPPLRPPLTVRPLLQERLPHPRVDLLLGDQLGQRERRQPHHRQLTRPDRLGVRARAPPPAAHRSGAP